LDGGTGGINFIKRFCDFLTDVGEKIKNHFLSIQTYLRQRENFAKTFILHIKISFSQKSARLTYIGEIIDKFDPWTQLPL